MLYSGLLKFHLNLKLILIWSFQKGTWILDLHYHMRLLHNNKFDHFEHYDLQIDVQVQLESRTQKDFLRMDITGNPRVA